MKKILFTCCVLLLMAFTTHKYYLSVTELSYNESEASLEMITRIFYDDLEKVLQERYDESLVVDATADQEKLDVYIKKYLDRKLQISVNGAPKEIHFIGKEYEDDYVVCYVEIPEVNTIKTIEIDNTLLMDIYTEQKNMVHTDILGKKKSFLLIEGNANAMLNFSE